MPNNAATTGAKRWRHLIMVLLGDGAYARLASKAVTANPNARGQRRGAEMSCTPLKASVRLQYRCRYRGSLLRDSWIKAPAPSYTTTDRSRRAWCDQRVSM